ncbi:hypothetical protein ACFIOY_35815 [Bradyrhizobium sp. TZ2]
MQQIGQEISSIAVSVTVSAAKISEIVGESEGLAASAGQAQEVSNSLSGAMIEFTAAARGISSEVSNVRGIVNGTNTVATAAAGNLVLLKR